VPPPPTASDTEKVLWKINPFLKPLIANFRGVYTPDRFIAVDESLMLWKGRLGIKQYMPLKRARWGLKSYELCESGSGYIWNSFIHTGRADQMDLVHSTDELTSSRIVLTLMEGLMGQGYRVYMDNFYSSPLLYMDLQQQNTDVSIDAGCLHHSEGRSLNEEQHVYGFLELSWHSSGKTKNLYACCPLSTMQEWRRSRRTEEISSGQQ